MDDIRQAFGSVVRQARLDRGWTQEDLADLTGLQPTYISDVERGRRSPGLTTQSRLASAFELRIWELMKLAEESIPGT